MQKKSSIKIEDNYVEVVEMVIFEKDKVEGINDFSDLEGKVMLPPAFHNHPIVEKELIFVEENLIHSDNPNNRKIVFVNIGDYIVALDVPADTDNQSPFIDGNSLGSSMKCKCNVAGKCTKYKKYVATFCNSDKCSDCTLSGIINNPRNGNTKSFTIKDDIITLN
ncbi:MAG: hypothetical protein CNE98_05295 [Bacteroidetes bacterium MED-G17]|nr:MAG: hypothetical protein CBB99_06920 [Bacteroidetes bacterium TMED39]PDH52159.1 MAG: hypothetical protein CNE98_05295 [Bacteroidetes bacterium MED-G17]